MPQLVNVPGVGPLSFPDGMSDADMAAAIQKNFPQIHQPQAPAGAAAPDTSDELPFTTPQQEAAFGKGLAVEAPQRVWAGIKQAGAGLADAGRFFMGSGPPTMTAAPGQGLRANPNTLAGQVTNAENARQYAAADAAEKTYGPGGGAMFQGGALAGEAALSAAPAIATEGLVSPATTLLGNMGRQAAVGGATGAMSFSPDNRPTAPIGALGGAGLGFVGGAINTARNVVARAIRATAPRSEAAYQAAKDVMGWGTPEAAAAGGEPTLAMRTGSPTARTFESQAYNSRLQETYQRNSDWFAARFKAVFDLPDTPAPELDSAFNSARSGAETAINGMRRQASSDYKLGMAKAAALSDQVLAPGEQAATRGPMTFQQGGVPQTGGATLAQTAGARVRASNFGEMLSVLSKQDADPVGGSQVLPKDWVAIVQARLQAGQGTLSVKDTAGVLRRLSGMRDAESPELRALANKLNDSFNADLDLVAQDGSGAHPAVRQIR